MGPSFPWAGKASCISEGSKIQMGTNGFQRRELAALLARFTAGEGMGQRTSPSAPSAALVGPCYAKQGKALTMEFSLFSTLPAPSWRNADLILDPNEPLQWGSFSLPFHLVQNQAGPWCSRVLRSSQEGIPGGPWPASDRPCMQIAGKIKWAP